MTVNRWLALIAFAACAPAVWPAPPEAEIIMHVAKGGPVVLIDVDCPVRAPLPVIWELLTDYDHMTAFISNLQQSSVETRVGNVLTVRQRGKASLGPFSVEFDGVREVDIVPLVEIRSHHLSGDLRESAFTTRVVDVEGSFHIIHIGRHTPNRWAPPLIGPSLIAAETRKQFDAFRQEILRRSARPPVSPAARVRVESPGNDVAAASAELARRANPTPGRDTPYRKSVAALTGGAAAIPQDAKAKRPLEHGSRSS
jgi:hypothetical protein